MSANAPGHDPTVAGVDLDPRDAKNLVGRVIADRYRVDAVLGEGGMGAVLRCHHLGLKRDIALKILHAELGNNPEISARFAREAQSASRLEHPNCVQVMDFGEWRYDDDAPPMQYLAMQLLDGHELTEELGRPLPTTRAVDLMLQVLAGLEHAHAHGIVHRDLKPENIFVTHDHEGKELLKLVDFGIAKIVSGDGAKDGMTRAGLIFGTPKYMSPEQGTGSDVDQRTDVYSAGVILYEMLSGHTPFDADDVVSLIRKQISEDPPPLPAFVPRPLAALVDRMLAKLRDERFANIAEVRAALRELRPTLEVDAAAPAPSTFVQTLARSGTVARVRTLSGAHDVASAVRRVTLQGQRLASGLEPKHRRMLGIAAGGLGFVLLLVLVWPSGDGDGNGDGDEKAQTASAAKVALPRLEKSEPESQAPPEAERGLLDALPIKPKAPGDDLAEVDRLIEAKNLAAAATRLNQLIDEYPDDPRLRIRRGRIQARAKKKDDKALDSYEKALDLDPSLLQDEALLEEIVAVMRQPGARDKALDLAVRKLGERGHDFLITLLNEDNAVLGYVDRHRALDAISSSKTSLDKVNRELNVALDLWQANQSLTPCESFSRALTTVEEEPSAYYLGTLHRVSPPKSNGDDPMNRVICDALPTRLEAVRNSLVERYHVPPKQWTVPAAYAPKKKRRRRGWFR